MLNVSPERLGPAWVWLGAALRQRREARELTLRDLERLCRVSYSHLANIEDAKRKLNVDVARKIAPHLGWTPGELSYLALRAEHGLPVMAEVAEAAAGVAHAEIDTRLRETWDAMTPEQKDDFLKYGKYLASQEDK